MTPQPTPSHQGTPRDDAPHRSVLLAEVVEALAPRDGGVYVDGTFGAGGYSRALLESADCRVLGIDRDPDAVAAAAPLVADHGGRLVVRRGRFAQMRDLAGAEGVDPADGVALDLGVSSMQLDQGARGFSFARPGPLDMRMDQGADGGPSATDLVNDLDEGALARLLRDLGEERQARRVAKAIVAARASAPIETTQALADIVGHVLGSGRDRIHPATRTFQALRIRVNRELAELDEGLEAAERLLRPGGRLAVVSFHSLEDRRVKRFLRRRSGDVPSVSRHSPMGGGTPPRAPTFRLLGRKAVTPSQSEILANPRARSARLRAAERTDAPAWPSEIDDLGGDHS